MLIGPSIFAPDKWSEYTSHITNIFFYLGIGDKSKFLRASSCSYGLANSFEEQRCVFCKAWKGATSKNGLSIILDMWGYSSECFGPFLCLGWRGRFNTYFSFYANECLIFEVCKQWMKSSLIYCRRMWVLL